MKRTAITIVVGIWWIASLFFFWQSNKTQEIDFDEVPVVQFGDIEAEVYHSVYLRGEKIGYTSSIRQKVETGYMIQDVSYMQLPIGGILQEVVAEMIISLDKEMKVLNFSFEFSSDDYNSLIDGKFTDNQLEYTIETEEALDTRIIPVEGDVYTPAIVPLIAARDNFSQQIYSIPVFDPMTMTMRSYTIKLDRNNPVTSPRGDENVYKLYSTYNDYTNTMWVDTSGQIVMEQMAAGFESYREPKEQALKFDMNNKPGFDLLTSFAVTNINYAKQKLERPNLMRMKLEGVDPKIFELTDFNQAFDSLHSILTIYSEGFSGSIIENDTLIQGLYTVHEVVPDDTAETTFIQKNDRRIRDKAIEITRNLENDTEKLRAINGWLYTKIEKDYRSSIPSALDVLKKMVGDCNEHTTLFVAMARSLDIPCRITVGLVRVDDEFIYHAWPKAYADGRWQTFEPTHGYYPCDATHIKLLEGSLNQQIEIMRLSEPRILIYEEADKPEDLLDGGEFLRTRVDSTGSPTKLTRNIGLGIDISEGK